MTAADEKIVYHEWDSVNEVYVRYPGKIRVVPGGEDVNVRHSKRHLTIYDEEEVTGERQINNVENIEFWENSEQQGENFWTHDLESQI